MGNAITANLGVICKNELDIMNGEHIKTAFKNKLGCFVGVSVIPLIDGNVFYKVSIVSRDREILLKGLAETLERLTPYLADNHPQEIGECGDEDGNDCNCFIIVLDTNNEVVEQKANTLEYFKCLIGEVSWMNVYSYNGTPGSETWKSRPRYNKTDLLKLI